MWLLIPIPDDSIADAELSPDCIFVGDTDSEYLAESQSGFLAEYFSDINLDDQSEDSLTTASLEWFSSCEEISFLNWCTIGDSCEEISFLNWFTIDWYLKNL